VAPQSSPETVRASTVPRSPAHRAFGQAVRELRRRRGVSQERLALDHGIDRKYVSGIERGVANPTLAIILQIAEGLDLPPSALFERFERKLHG